MQVPSRSFGPRHWSPLLFLLGAWFRSEFYDQSVAPLVLGFHEFRYLLGQFRLIVSIDDSA